MILTIRHFAKDRKKKKKTRGENRSAAFRSGGRKQKEDSTEKSKITLYSVNP